MMIMTFDHDNCSLGTDQPLKPQRRPEMKRSVSFSSIEVRGYGIALGDNPSCSYGPAITLNWDYNEETRLSVDDYEELRMITRRTKNEMIMPSIVREAIIMSNGYSRSEIKGVMDETKKIKKSRCKTAFQTPRQQRTAEIIESFTRNQHHYLQQSAAAVMVVVARAREVAS